jgi:hypothetical protein
MRGMKSPPDSLNRDAASFPDVSAPAGGMTAANRWSIYAILIVISLGLVTARIMRNRSPDRLSRTPFQSANDKSRWCTIRAIGDHGVYSIEHIIFYDNGEPVRGWHTIDLVRHRGPDGREHYYSSKPTLLSTLLAGEYWLIKRTTGMSLAVPSQVWFVSRLVLFLTNVLPLAVALVLLAQLVERLGTTDWGRLFAMACAACATFVTTYSATLNNHSLAAVTMICALAALLPIVELRGRAWHFAAAGLSLAFTAANELPALSILLLVGAGLAWRFPLRTILYFAPPVALVALGAFGTNFYAHGDWRTPYAHRQDGPKIGQLPDSLAVPLNENQLSPEVREALEATGLQLSNEALVTTRTRGDRWELFDPRSHRRYALQRTPEGASSLGIDIRQWDNWYDYPNTHWDRATVTGLDRGEASPLVYALHCLVGHHGIFSLTPIWLLSVAGCAIWLRGKGRLDWRALDMPQLLAITTAIITVVVVGFYLTRPQMDRNYGGGTCCLRWLVWLTPLWLLTLLPAADRLSPSRLGRGAALMLLAVSVFSAHYAADNPWADPWIFNLGTWLGWWAYP